MYIHICSPNFHLKVSYTMDVVIRECSSLDYRFGQNPKSLIHFMRSPNIKESEDELAAEHMGKWRNLDHLEAFH